MAFYMEKEKTASTPFVLIDEEKGYMRMEGRCFHEKAADFFMDINEWLDSWLLSDFGSFTFDCAMEYFNSSTTKLLHNMFLKMDKRVCAEKKIIVNWITTEDNEIMVECGEDFREDVSNLEFNIVIREEG